MKIAICDDERQFLDHVCILLEKWAARHDLRPAIYRFTNGDDLIDSHMNECMDLIILDIIMPLLNGIDTAKELRNNNHAVPIIFLTSSRDFAVDSYEVKAFHYITKPIEDIKLFSVLDDFLKTYHLAKKTFTAQTSIGFYRIVIAEVDYLEAQNKQVIVHLTNGRTIEIRERFSECEKIFSPDNGFCRCHRSYIVNLNNIEQFSKTQISTIHNAVIPISRNSYNLFKETYFHYMFG